jgi:hypothetical protein
VTPRRAVLPALLALVAVAVVGCAGDARGPEPTAVPDAVFATAEPSGAPAATDALTDVIDDQRTPDGLIRAFYGRIAVSDWSGACALASPEELEVFGGAGECADFISGIYTAVVEPSWFAGPTVTPELADPRRAGEEAFSRPDGSDGTVYLDERLWFGTDALNWNGRPNPLGSSTPGLSVVRMGDLWYWETGQTI